MNKLILLQFILVFIVNVLIFAGMITEWGRIECHLQKSETECADYSSLCAWQEKRKYKCKAVAPDPAVNCPDLVGAFACIVDVSCQWIQQGSSSRCLSTCRLQGLSEATVEGEECFFSKDLYYEGSNCQVNLDEVASSEFLCQNLQEWSNVFVDAFPFITKLFLALYMFFIVMFTLHLSMFTRKFSSKLSNSPYHYHRIKTQYYILTSWLILGFACGCISVVSYTMTDEVFFDIFYGEAMIAVSLIVLFVLILVRLVQLVVWHDNRPNKDKATQEPFKFRLHDTRSKTIYYGVMAALVQNMFGFSSIALLIRTRDDEAPLFKTSVATAILYEISSALQLLFVLGSMSNKISNTFAVLLTLVFSVCSFGFILISYSALFGLGLGYGKSQGSVMGAFIAAIVSFCLNGSSYVLTLLQTESSHLDSEEFESNLPMMKRPTQSLMSKISQERKALKVNRMKLTTLDFDNLKNYYNIIDVSTRAFYYGVIMVAIQNMLGMSTCFLIDYNPERDGGTPPLVLPFAYIFVFVSLIQFHAALTNMTDQAPGLLGVLVSTIFATIAFLFAILTAVSGFGLDSDYKLYHWVALSAAVFCCAAFVLHIAVFIITVIKRTYLATDTGSSEQEENEKLIFELEQLKFRNMDLIQQIKILEVKQSDVHKRS